MPKKIGFRIEIEPKGEYDANNWTMRLLPMEYDEQRQYWTGYGSCGGFAENAMSHLVIEAFGDNRDRHIYRSFEVRVKNIYSAHAGEIAAMHKLLSGIERSLSKASEEDGSVMSFGQYCLRVAKAVKAQYFLFLKEDGKHLPQDERWHVRTLSYGKDCIDYEIRKWQEEGKEKAA